MKRGRKAQAEFATALTESARNLGQVLGEMPMRAPARKPLRSVQAALLRAADSVAADSPAAAADALDAAAAWWRRAVELAPKAANSPGAKEQPEHWESWAGGLRRMAADRRTLRGRLRAWWAALRGGEALARAARRLRGG